MLLEVNLLTVCHVATAVLPPHGRWVAVASDLVPLKHRSVAADYFGYRVSTRDGESNYICVKLEPQLVEVNDIKRVQPWELYHRDGSDGEVGGMKMYKLTLADGSHIKAALTTDAYQALLGC